MPGIPARLRDLGIFERLEAALGELATDPDRRDHLLFATFQELWLFLPLEDLRPLGDVLRPVLDAGFHVDAHIREAPLTNLPEWRAHLLTRLHRQAETTGDERLKALHAELSGYPGGETARPDRTDVVVPLRYHADHAELSFLSITAMIGTPMDITVEELAIESFYPADDRTAAALAADA